MSVSHHGEEHSPEHIAEQKRHLKRLMDQFNGTAKREYTAGRMGAEDDGTLSYAIAADRLHNTVIIRFGKPVEWIGLGPKDVESLREKLLEKLIELQAGVAD